MTKEKKAQIYSLCVKWLLVVEKNADLITRCISYNFIGPQLYQEYSEEIKKLNCPNKPFLIQGKHRIIEYCLNFIVENVCSKALNGVLSRVKKFVVSYCIYYFFGLTLMSGFSVVTSVVKLPFLNDSRNSMIT